jgi:hypothetical protein
VKNEFPLRFGEQALAPITRLKREMMLEPATNAGL